MRSTALFLIRSEQGKCPFQQRIGHVYCSRLGANLRPTNEQHHPTTDMWNILHQWDNAAVPTERKHYGQPFINLDGTEFCPCLVDRGERDVMLSFWRVEWFGFSLWQANGQSLLHPPPTAHL